MGVMCRLIVGILTVCRLVVVNVLGVEEGFVGWFVDACLRCELFPFCCEGAGVLEIAYEQAVMNFSRLGIDG